MKEFFAASPVLAWSIVSVMIALLTISILWTKVKWWWHNTWYSFPLIGKVSSLSTDTNRDSVDQSWFKAEKTLCRDYKKFIRIQDEHDFNVEMLQREFRSVAACHQLLLHDLEGMIVQVL